MTVDVAEVRLWGTTIGAVTWDDERALGAFEYEPRFRSSGIEVAPLTMPLGPAIYSFGNLERGTYLGLPPMLADSLPDKFGMTLIDAWLAEQGRPTESFSPVERLCYVGDRGMGALEYSPAIAPFGEVAPDRELEVANLVALANRALAEKADLDIDSAKEAAAPDERDLSEIIRVGTSAGGARAKAVIGWNEKTGQIRSGQLQLPPDFSHWLLKFDGVAGNRDKELADPLGFGRIEQAYAQMARAAGITMARTRLLEEGGRAHFMTERFDRIAGDKLHMQTLAAIAHFDFNRAGAYSYEQALEVMRRLGLSQVDLTQQFRRAIFNIVARNQDDHTKNIGFLMDRSGTWSLAPAYDVTYAYNPDGAWTSDHQMSLNGKRNGFERSDVAATARQANLSEREGLAILDEVTAGVERWPVFAAEAGVSPASVDRLEATFRTTSLTASQEIS